MKTAHILGAVGLISIGIGAYLMVARPNLHSQAVAALEDHLAVSTSGETSVRLEGCQLDFEHTAVADNGQSMQTSHMRLNLRAYDTQTVNLRKQDNGITVITLKRSDISDQTLANAQAVLKKVPDAYSRQDPNTLTRISNDGTVTETRQMPVADISDEQLRTLLQTPNGALTFNLSVAVPAGADGVTQADLQPHEDAPAFHTFVKAIAEDEALVEYGYLTNYIGTEAAPDKLLIGAVRVPPVPRLAAHSEEQAKLLAQALLQYSTQECR